MGKRSDFTPRPQDRYFTPAAGVIPLLPFLPSQTWFAEPCAGDGRLFRHLEEHNHICACSTDIIPEGEWVFEGDARELGSFINPEAKMIITNPPWSRPI